MSDEMKPEPITYLLRRSGCVSGLTESSFEVAIKKALDMPPGSAVVELYEWPNELITRLRAENERLREALRDCVSALKHPIRPINNDGSLLNNIKFEVGRDMAVNAALRRVRAALEGVTDAPANIQTGEKK